MLVTSFKKRTADERERQGSWRRRDSTWHLYAEEIEQGRFASLAEVNEMLGRFDFLPETDTLLRISVEHNARRR
ncbi:MAG: hypothetical protein U0531_12770 [Dehalococcoidia bacterium]